MNTQYKLGNASSFVDYKFPNQLPTEEWAGNEIRAYSNYIRPIANLFENDRENEMFAKDAFSSIFSMDKNSVISGCAVNVIDTYYEVGRGTFINKGKIYYIFPACEIEAKRLGLSGKLWYDVLTGEFVYESSSGSPKRNTSAIGILKAIDSEITSEDLLNSLLMPILSKETGTVCFDGTSGKILVKANIDITNNDTVFGENAIPAKLSGTNIDANIPAESITNGFVQIGSTKIALMGSSASLTGIDSINNLTLASAASRTVTTDLSTNDALPTASAVKNYVNNKSEFTTAASFASTVSFAKQVTFASSASFAGQITAANETLSGKLSVTNNSASSIETAGGIQAAGNIVSNGKITAANDIEANGNIIGNNVGVKSSRAAKENITEFSESAVDILNTVNIVNFNYKDDKLKKHRIGFIADDTHEYLATDEHNKFDFANCIGLLIKAVQELSAENKELRKALNDYKS